MRIKDILVTERGRNGLPGSTIDKLLAAGFNTVSDLEAEDEWDLVDKAGLSHMEATDVVSYVERLTDLLDEGFFAYTYSTNCICRRCRSALRTSDRKNRSFMCFDCDSTFDTDSVRYSDDTVITIDIDKDSECYSKLEKLCEVFVANDWATGFSYDNGIMTITVDDLRADFSSDIDHIITYLNWNSISPGSRRGITADLVDF